jgi:hypothetical protein
MNGAGALGCVSVRAVLFFCENPDEELSTPDLGAKFGGCSKGNGQALKRAVHLGLLARSCAGRGCRATYTAGPKLRAMLAAGAARLQG